MSHLSTQSCSRMRKPCHPENLHSNASLIALGSTRALCKLKQALLPAAAFRGQSGGHLVHYAPSEAANEGVVLLQVVLHALYHVAHAQIAV